MPSLVIGEDAGLRRFLNTLSLEPEPRHNKTEYPGTRVSGMAAGHALSVCRNMQSRMPGKEIQHIRDNKRVPDA